MKQKRDEHGNELVEFSFAICINDNDNEKGNGNENDNTADINSAPTEEERKAAATAPILYTIAQSKALARAAHTQAARAAAEDAARSIADELINIVFRPTKTNKHNLIEAVAGALHIASVAAWNCISVDPQRYDVDYNSNHLTGMFVTAVKAILEAHDDGREEDEVYLASLYDNVAQIIRNAAQRVPIRHADAANITDAIDAMNEAVLNT